MSPSLSVFGASASTSNSPSSGGFGLFGDSSSGNEISLSASRKRLFKLVGARWKVLRDSA